MTDENQTANHRDSASLQLLRLKRRSEQLGLPEGVQQWIDSQLNESHNNNKKQPSQVSESKSAQEKKLTATTSKPEQLPTAARKAGGIALEEAESVLRRLIAADRDWQEMCPHAWQVYDRWPRPEVAARLVELAFTHGGAGDVAALLERLQSRNHSFYFMVNPHIRENLVLQLWQQRREGALNHFLHLKGFRSFLLPVEHFYVFWSLYNSHQKERTWQYFKRYEREILKGFHGFGSHLKLSSSRFYFLVGKLAFDLKDERRARDFLEQIGPSDKEFYRALDILVQFQVERDAHGLCVFSRQLVREKDWRQRLVHLENFLRDCKARNGSRHAERIALNDVLGQVLRWFPRHSEAWWGLSKLLVSFCDMEYLLPNILRVFSEQRFQFESPGMDRALWEPVLEMSSEFPVRNLYWRAMARIHHFIALGCREEKLLWQAREAFVQASEQASLPQQDSWPDIHQRLVSFIAKSPRYEEDFRKECLVRVRVTGASVDIEARMVLDYVALQHRADVSVLARLQTVVAERQDATLEVELIRHFVNMRHLTNANLDRLWYLSRKLKNDDLAWRIASLAFARQSIDPEIERAWSLMGERRLDAAFRPLPVNLLERVIADFQLPARQLLRAFLSVGPLLPELLSYLSQDVRLVKKDPVASQVERALESAMQKTEWLPEMKRYFSSHPERRLIAPPPFVLSLPENPWTLLFMNLSLRLGIGAWNWKFSFLFHEMEGLYIHLSRRRDLALPSKVGRWLRMLTPIQRKSWYDLGALAKQLSDEEVVRYLSCFVSRVSLCMTADHVQSLASLAQMGAPLDLRWDLERFILSQAYQEIRQSQRTIHRTPVPQRLPSSLTASTAV